MAHPATPAEMLKSSVPDPNPIRRDYMITDPDTTAYLDDFKSEPPAGDIDFDTGVPAPPDVFEPPRKFDSRDLSIHSKEGLPIREFDTGATRDQEGDKYDYEGFLSPLALVRFAAYMHENRVQSDGTLRASDNWQKGIPLSSYMKSMLRHMMTVWCHHREVPEKPEGDLLIKGGCESLEDALCGVIFNAQGYLHEIMKAKGE